jgi:hypothetical protein
VVLLRYLDVALLVVAAPVMLLIGVPAAGYLIGAGAWIALRAVAVAVDHQARGMSVQQGVGLRLGFLLSRLFLLAIAVILVRKSDGRDPGLAALLVIVFAFTVEFFLSFLSRPRRSK